MKKMKNLILLLILIYVNILISCSISPSEKAEKSIKKYLKENLKNYNKYKPISFTPIDTLISKESLNEVLIDTSNDIIPIFEIKHSYNIINSNNDNVKLNILFYLDKNLKVVETNINGINGDYSTLC